MLQIPNKIIITLRFIISDKIAGVFIGKNGWKIQELRKSLNDGRISISEASREDRIVTLTHINRREVFKSLKICLDRIHEADKFIFQIVEEVKNPLIKIKFLVPAQWLNEVSLRDIMSIQMKSGTLVEFARDLVGVEALMLITGEAANIVTCYEEIYDKWSPGRSCKLGGHVDHGCVMETPELQYKQEIIIPNAHIGCIIGLRGTTIENIRLQSNAEIWISEDKSSESRMVVIMGGLKSVMMATDIIRKKFVTCDCSFRFETSSDQVISASPIRPDLPPCSIIKAVPRFFPY